MIVLIALVYYLRKLKIIKIKIDYTDLWVYTETKRKQFRNILALIAHAQIKPNRLGIDRIQWSVNYPISCSLDYCLDTTSVYIFTTFYIRQADNHNLPSCMLNVHTSFHYTGMNLTHLLRVSERELSSFTLKKYS